MHAVRMQCACSAKFWMSTNTRALVSAPFHKFLVLYQGLFSLPKHLGCGIFELSRCTTQDKRWKALKEIMFESFEDARQDQLPKHKWQGTITH